MSLSLKCDLKFYHDVPQQNIHVPLETPYKDSSSISNYQYTKTKFSFFFSPQKYIHSHTQSLTAQISSSLSQSSSIKNPYASILWHTLNSPTSSIVNRLNCHEL
ncbi:hypothetical protein VNO80_03716 [Phaseolus coccineus]|uniref:Uncharacterized protein n=1 Tax=Phaseolus coccineus TaxID=3886 RepID=A0AAN9NWL5_PHACN